MYPPVRAVPIISNLGMAVSLASVPSALAMDTAISSGITASVEWKPSTIRPSRRFCKGLDSEREVNMIQIENEQID